MSDDNKKDALSKRLYAKRYRYVPYVIDILLDDSNLSNRLNRIALSMRLSLRRSHYIQDVCMDGCMYAQHALTRTIAHHCHCQLSNRLSVVLTIHATTQVKTARYHR
jgi:hypothetical protein